MSIKDRINKLKGKIDARAEEMTVKQENEMRKESIALTKRLKNKTLKNLVMVS